MYDILDEVANGWEGNCMQPITIDLTTDAGFDALEKRVYEEVASLYFTERDPETYGFNSDAYNRLAGRALGDVADQLARDLMQESVSIPRSAFADHERAGRELAIIQRVARRMYLQALTEYIRQSCWSSSFTFPSGHTPLRPPAHATHERQPRTRK